MDRLLIVIGTLFLGVATLVSVLTLSSPFDVQPTHDMSTMPPLEPLPPIELGHSVESSPSSVEAAPSESTPTLEPERPSWPSDVDERIRLVTGGTSRLGWGFASSNGWRAGNALGAPGGAGAVESEGNFGAART